MTIDQPPTDDPEGVGTDLIIEAPSREDGKNSTVRVYPDRIEWVKEISISSVARSKNDPPVIPLGSVLSVKVKKDGPLFTKVILRTANAQIVFRMVHAQAAEVREAIGEAMASLPST